MTDTIEGDDGLPADVAQPWTKHKHDRLRHYLSISSAARNRFITGRARSAVFIDLFCGAGRAWVEETKEWIDGSSVAAWNISKESGAPFTEIYVADKNEERRKATVERLKRLKAPVEEVPGSAVEAVDKIVGKVNEEGAHGLHFAFIDPYSLGALDFDIIESLAKIKRIDMMLHVSKMDFQRNLERYIANEDSAFDKFAPGFRKKVDLHQPQQSIRIAILNHWKSLVESNRKTASSNWDLVTGNQGQHLYWLLLVAKHDLAQHFWNEAIKTEQGNLFS